MARSTYMPAEWALHDACWVAWPWDASLWSEDGLRVAQTEFVAMCRAISGIDFAGAFPLEKLFVLTPMAYRAQASEALQGLPIEIVEGRFGDIWVRDTGPVFIEENGSLRANIFRFNGWGEKYVLPHDDEVASQIAEALETDETRFDWVLEGGAVEFDGEGTCLTTRDCLLNPNRGTGLTEKLWNERLQEAFGVGKVIWLDAKLENDHTDGHIDTLARFVAPGHVVCMEATTQEDPNAAMLLNLKQQLLGAQDTAGRKLRVTSIPSPGRVAFDDDNDRIMPASYLNFYIANRTVVVPTYGTPQDAQAVEQLSALFPGRKTIGRSAKQILTGGGAFHCITQQQPTPRITGKNV